MKRRGEAEITVLVPCHARSSRSTRASRAHERTQNNAVVDPRPYPLSASELDPPAALEPAPDANAATDIDPDPEPDADADPDGPGASHLPFPFPFPFSISCSSLPSRTSIPDPEVDAARASTGGASHIRTVLSSEHDANMRSFTGFHATELTLPSPCPESSSRSTPESRCQMYTFPSWSRCVERSQRICGSW